jgi:hypothetical protein
MFKKNTKHFQPALISAASELPEKQLKLLKKSWANTFYHKFFSRIDEEIFEVLYSSEPSRPNVPVNVMVGLEVLKAGFGWSDAELYENYCFNLQVRYGLGYDRLGDGDFAIRTLYYFRERLSRYYLESGLNLLEQAFEQITDIQIQDLQVRTGMQRMDSTQIASNIVNASRLQLLVEAIQRTYRILREVDQNRLAESFAPYLKETAGHYTYRVKGKESVQEHLQRVGAVIYHLIAELKEIYAAEETYQVLERIFTENFHLIEEKVSPKENQELASDSLQSLDDLEASFRTKGKVHYKGYVTNITETCEPENDLQLITKVQVAPNNTDDSQLLIEALPNLKERTDLKTLVTDGGHGSPSADMVLCAQHIQHLQTAIRGRKPNPDKLYLADFNIEFDTDGNPFDITCPQGQTASVQPSLHKKAWVAHFATETCSTCPLADQCPAHPRKRDPRFHLRFTQDHAHAAKRRRQSQKQKQEGRNLRAAVEATMRSIKHPFPAGKLPVRGRFRVTCLLIGSAAVTNIRRIQRYMEAKLKDQNQLQSVENKQNSTQNKGRDSLFCFSRRFFRCQILPIWVFNP